MQSGLIRDNTLDGCMLLYYEKRRFITCKFTVFNQNYPQKNLQESS